ncbi:MAG: hypothetical protein HYX32_00865 [Actinobacteria bacterium]|nr:hypothetical protein [Actinomycetota bacterium]
MRRALAVLAVVVLLAMALFIRGRVQETRQTAADEKAKATLYCAEELKPVCDELKASDRNLTVVTEPATATLAKITAPDFSRSTSTIDGWLAPQPFVDAANEARARAGLDPLFTTPSRVLARSPVVMVGWADRLRALAGACGGQVSWKCLGERAGARWTDLGGQEQWGDLRPVVPAPATSATGQLTAGEAAASYFGNSAFASNDFADRGFREWMGRLARASSGVSLSKPTPLDQLLFAGPSSLDVAGAIEAQAGPSVASSRDKDRLTILYPAPMATADVVLAPISGSEPGGRLRDVLESEPSARALAQNGWRVNGQPLAAGLKPDVTLPDSSGLPRAGVLQALASAWQGAGQ